MHDETIGTRSNPSSPSSPSGGRGVALAGLILAVAALVALLTAARVGLPALLVALVSALAGLVLSALGHRSPPAKTLARVGLILSLIEVMLMVLFILLVIPASVQRH